MTPSRFVYPLIGLFVLALVTAFATGSSFAADAVVTPGGAVVVPEGTAVRIPWGAWLSELSSTLSTVLFAAVIWGFRRLPSSIVALLQTMRAEQLIQKAIDYGLNATAGASKDKILSINVGNEVLAKAITYATEQGAPRIIGWLGGPEGISKKIIARLELPPEAAVTDSPTEIAVIRPAA